MDSAEPSVSQPVSKPGGRGELIAIAAGVGTIAVGLIIRTDIFTLIMSIILEILGWASVVAGIVAIGAAIYSYGNKRAWWDPVITFVRQKNLTPMLRGIFSSATFFLVLLFLLLPWLSVSGYGRSDSTLGITMLGITGSSGSENFGDTGAMGVIATIAPYLIVLLAVAGIALFFLRDDQRGNHIRAAIGGVGVLALITLAVSTRLVLADVIGVDISQLGVSLNWAIGYWLSLIAFIAAIALQYIPMPTAKLPIETFQPQSEIEP